MIRLAKSFGAAARALRCLSHHHVLDIDIPEAKERSAVLLQVPNHEARPLKDLGLFWTGVMGRPNQMDPLVRIAYAHLEIHGVRPYHLITPGENGDHLVVYNRANHSPSAIDFSLPILKKIALANQAAEKFLRPDERERVSAFNQCISLRRAPRLMSKPVNILSPELQA